ncbi:MAG: FliO/MopB family protein [Bdellovibrionales bacterium]|nr:FliO/MopB family protein [Bdellovibrionales bacterium]
MKFSSMVSWIILCATFASPAWAGKNQIESVQSSYFEGKLVSEIVFTEPFHTEDLNIEYINETVQFDFKGATFPEKKRLTPIDGSAVRNLYTYQFSPTEARHRVIYQKGISAEALKDYVSIKKEGNKLTLEIADPPSVVMKPSNKNDKAGDGKMDFADLATVITSDESQTARIDDEEIIEAAMNEVSETNKKDIAIDTKVAASTESNVPQKTPNESKVETKKDLKSEAQKLSENEIPVLQNSKETKSQSGVSWLRVAVSLFLVVGLIAFVTVFGKRWIKTSGVSNQKTGIKVLTQYHIAPKRTLAIIQVAGESILIGMTDHSITPIKTLSLLDEEVPELETGRKFEGELSGVSINEERYTATQATGEEDEFTMSGLKELITDKLKGRKEI